MSKTKMIDAQVALTFLANQAEYIETEVEKIDYPEVQYPDLIPVDFSAPEWTKTVTYYSQDSIGKADWFAANARDVPRADVSRAKHETGVEMAAIGYGYNIEEISQAQTAGIALTTEKAEAAKMAYETFVDDVALLGDSDKNFFGLIDYPGVTAVLAAATGDQNGAVNSTLWVNKTPDQIALDINTALTAIYVNTKQMGMPNVILLPVEAYSYVVTTRFDPNAQMTILDWILKTNIYTATTRQPLEIRAVRGLESAGAGGTGRMIIYRRDPKVLKMHIPMRHRFIDPMRTGPLIYEVPGIFRLGGVDVKRPAYIRYVDGISEPE